MPYRLSKDGLCVEKADTGETVKCHDAHDQAVAHLQALEANVSEAHKNDEVKVGARNSGKDQQRLQMMHDYSVDNGAICKGGKALELDEILVYMGGAVKALDGGKVAGYLIRYSSADEKDLTGDYFTSETDYGDALKTAVLYQHGLDKTVKRRKIGSGELSKDEVGIWIEAQLNLRDEYEKAIYELAQTGKLGWSSGTAGHLVEREAGGKMIAWPLGLDASLTPTPAEPRNGAVSLKSWKTPEADMDDKDEIKATLTKEYLNMDEKEFKALLDESNKGLVAVIEEKADAAAQKAVDAVLDKLPEVKAKMNTTVTVVIDEADQPFKSVGDFFMAVKGAALHPSEIDKRLLPLKATGMSESQPSQAGFLVPQETAAGIIEKIYGVGTLLNLFSNRDTVTGNNMTYNLVDETSRADGSRFGGVQGYWLAEAATKTASKPKFRQLEMKLKKVVALCVATDELLEDAAALQSWLMRSVPEELRFKVEDAIINGDGVGKPLGILNSGAFKSAVRADANLIAAADIGRMWAARWAGVNDYVWFGNQSIFPQLLGLSISNMPVFVTAGGLSNLPYSSLLGRPYYDIEYAPALGTLGDLMLISPSQYQMIEKGGIQSASSIHVYFTTNETAFRFEYRIDGAPIWNSLLTGKDANTYSPYVGLAATT